MSDLYLNNNTLKVETDGTVEFQGDGTVFDDLRIVPGAFSFAGVGDPNLIDWQPGGSGATLKIQVDQDKN